ncbi:hypothetical protein AVJ23_05275 [Pseudoponticoccus marisrubri]|uniref:DUF2333 domain-containing protein n=1 Tax=Pseudoponticoccus marisrubri TaxID=1685382 RepID=A0A0W7WNG1_9RHOB|nr:hypothetical protein AVJ23_05275 [Pseudoponticoccus marisrubri]
MVSEVETDAREGRGVKIRRIGGRGIKYTALALVLAATVNYGILGTLAHDIDNDPAFRATEIPEGGSSAVATAAALIDREVNQNGWTPNDPFFAPTALLDNMPNFQAGIRQAVGRFSFEMLDQIARTRGSSSSDADLERATGFLQFPPDIWMWQPTRSLLPTVPSESQYRDGLAALMRYNARLSAGDAVFEPRADTLANTLTRISADIGSLTAQLDRAQQTGWWVFSNTADDVFYYNKGVLYGYYVILSALGEDFEAVIRERNLANVWEQALSGLRQGAELNPAIVLNGDLESSIFANHLALQGFYMKRAILQFEEAVGVMAI